MEYIKREQCLERHLYHIASRNLKFGVFDVSSNGFIGMREKFGDRYAFTEFHYDNGPPYGTVRPLKLLEEKLPDDILLAEMMPGRDGHFGSWCSNCGVESSWEKFETPQERIWSDGKPWLAEGEWVHLDKTDCTYVKSSSRSNTKLEEWLESMEKKYAYLRFSVTS